jgi:hypothetical protein
MADPVPNAGAAAGAAAAPAETWEKKLGGIARSIAMFMAMQYGEFVQW